jgi:ABC-type sugar transport system permease subunit
LPAVVLMLVLLAYPFVLAAYISMSSRVLGEPGKSISFRNFLKLLQGSLFRQTVWKPFGKGAAPLLPLTVTPDNDQLIRG